MAGGMEQVTMITTQQRRKLSKRIMKTERLEHQKHILLKQKHNQVSSSCFYNPLPLLYEGY